MGASASVVDTRESYASEEMKVVIALAVIALFGSAIATGSAPAGYEGEVDVLPEDDELVQAQAGNFFAEVARLKQPAKASWSKLERPVKVVKAGLPQDFAFSDTASQAICPRNVMLMLSASMLAKMPTTTHVAAQVAWPSTTPTSVPIMATQSGTPMFPVVRSHTACARQLRVLRMTNSRRILRRCSRSPTVTSKKFPGLSSRATREVTQ